MEWLASLDWLFISWGFLILCFEFILVALRLEG